MSLRINTNTTALNALRNLQSTTNAVATSIERLSSGLRINRAADDPAGLIISENLRAQIDGMNQAVANSQDAMNLIKTAEGALNEINMLLRSIRTLAVHAANTGVNDSGAVRADQSQIDSAIASIDRIATQTQFGTKHLLDGTSGITSSVIDTKRLAGIYIGGTFDAAQTATSDVTITVSANHTATRARFIGERTFAGVNAVMGTGNGTLVINGQTVKVDVSDTVQSVINKINALSAAMAAGKGREELGRMLDYLGKYAIEHFTKEEAAMTRYRCPAAEANKQAHQQFVARFKELRAKFSAQGAQASMAIDIYNELSNWLIKHIRGIDVQLAKVVGAQTVGASH